jgi:leucyl-tRNA synthetase
LIWWSSEHHETIDAANLSKDAQDLRRKTHETIQKVSDDIERRHNGASKVNSVVIASRSTATSLSSFASNLLLAFNNSIKAAIAVLNQASTIDAANLSKDAQDLRRKTHETIQKVSDDIEIHVSRNGLHLQHLHQTILKIDLVEQRTS